MSQFWRPPNYGAYRPARVPNPRTRWFPYPPSVTPMLYNHQQVHPAYCSNPPPYYSTPRLPYSSPPPNSRQTQPPLHPCFFSSTPSRHAYGHRRPPPRSSRRKSRDRQAVAYSAYSAYRGDSYRLLSSSTPPIPPNDQELFRRELRRVDTSHSYSARVFHENERRGYMSAGILVYRPNNNDKSVDVLLALERRKKVGLTLNFLGGKRDRTDEHGVQTAVREFHEESGKIITEEVQAIMTRLLEDCGRVGEEGEGQFVFWFQGGKYCLYAIQVKELNELDAKFAERFSDLSKRPENMKSEALHWVDLQTLLSTVKSRKPNVQTCSGEFVPVFTFVQEMVSQLKFQRFTSSIITHCDTTGTGRKL